MSNPTIQHLGLLANRGHHPRTSFLILFVFFGLSSLSTISLAQQTAREVQIDETTVVRTALKNNPELAAALLDVRAAQQIAVSEEHWFTPTISFDVSASQNQSPFLGAGVVLVSDSKNLVLGSEMAHTLPWGTQLSLRLEGSALRSPTQMSTVSGGALVSELGYSIHGQFSVVQPLLRGFGKTVNEARIRQAKLSQTAAEQVRARTASELVRDSLIGYWDLWYATQAVAIEQSALGFAKQSRSVTAEQIQSGALARADLLSFDTRVMRLEQSVVMAKLAKDKISLALALQMGMPKINEQWYAADSPPSLYELPTTNTATNTALEASIELAFLKTQRAMATEQAKIAGEGDRSRLDLQLRLAAEGLGNDRATPALEQFGTLEATSAFVGLVYELPVSDARRTALQRNARLQVQAIQQRIRSLEQSIAARVQSDLATAITAQQRIELATKTALLAKEQLQVQQGRYEEGDSIALEVHQAEDALRAAQLDIARAQVDGIQASLRIQHFSNTLLQRYGGLSQ